MTADIINGREIAQNIRNTISKEIRTLSLKHKIIPTITTIKIGEDKSSELYLKLRDKACREVGIKSTHLEFNKKTSEDIIIDTIQNLNNDDTCHGILIQYPVPSHISQNKLMSIVHPKKDVEGFNPYNIGKTLLGDENIIPCTPASVLTILQHENIDLKGKEIVIINHSTIVGKPLAALLLNRNATVTVCHVFTYDLQKYTSHADILISATGKPKLISKNHVKEKAVIIDVGIIKTDNGICGDVDFHDIKEKVSKITPVPGGVGPVTIACSLQNMLKTYKKCLEDI
jgi:methylenetetrahydrofolate dehydrogenase (NADP+)/methenyltetrahydrofolate cyclohydrolase